jgi:cytochrome c553
MSMRSSRNHYFAVGVTAALFVLTSIGGFIVLPYAQPELKFASLWDAICSAAGLPQRTDTTEAPKPTHRLSEAVLTPTTLARPSQESIGRGATLAQRCAICHGPTGISRADSPNLAGQYASVIYKQLLDFRSGARTN